MPLGFRDLVTGDAKKRAYDAGNRAQIAADKLPKTPPKQHKYWGVDRGDADKIPDPKGDAVRQRLFSAQKKYKDVAKATTKARVGAGLGIAALALPLAAAATGSHRKAKAIEEAVTKDNREIASNAQKRTLDVLLQDRHFPVAAKLKILEGTGQIKLGQLSKEAKTLRNASMILSSGALAGLTMGYLSPNIKNNAKELGVSAATGAMVPLAGMGAYKALKGTPKGNKILKKLKEAADAD